MSEFESASEWTYDASVYRLCTETVEVMMEEATFDRYQNAYFIQYGIDSRTHAEPLAYVAHIQQQHLQAEIALHHPDYWVQMTNLKSALFGVHASVSRCR